MWKTELFLCDIVFIFLLIVRLEQYFKMFLIALNK